MTDEQREQQIKAREERAARRHAQRIALGRLSTSPRSRDRSPKVRPIKVDCTQEEELIVDLSHLFSPSSPQAGASNVLPNILQTPTSTPSVTVVAPIVTQNPQPIMANLNSTIRHSTFKGLGEDPDVHINRFNTVATANNQDTVAEKLRIFPATLDGFASEWYAGFPAGHFATWDALRQAFLDAFRPLGYADRVREELSQVMMMPHESVQTYANRVKRLISKRTNLTLPEDQVGWFVKGLPMDVGFHVRMQQPATLDAEIGIASNWEIAKMGAQFPTSNMMSQPLQQPMLQQMAAWSAPMHMGVAPAPLTMDPFSTTLAAPVNYGWELNNRSVLPMMAGVQSNIP